MPKIGYARVSTLEQNADLQIAALRAEGCDIIFTDTASGSQKCRPELTGCLNILQHGDVLVVWKIDRLARSTLHLCELIMNLKRRGVGFRSITQSIDTNTPGGMLTFQIFGAVAEFERELIRERTKSVMAAAVVRGSTLGRPRSKKKNISRATMYRRQREQRIANELDTKAGVAGRLREGVSEPIAEA